MRQGGEELLEVGKCIVRTRGGLRVILYGEERKLAVAHPLDGAVVEVQVRHFESAGSGNPIRIANHSEAMVLRSDEHLTGAEVAHRMVAAPMAVGELRRVTSERMPDELMPQADTEGGQA